MPMMDARPHHSEIKEHHHLQKVNDIIPIPALPAKLRLSQSQGRVEVSNRLRVLAMVMLAASNPKAAWQSAWHPTAAWQSAWPVSSSHAKLRSSALPSRREAAAHRVGLAPCPLRLAMCAEELDEFEQRALAGLWTGELDLDDGLQKMTCQVREGGACTGATSGNAFTSGMCSWDARVKHGGESGSSQLSMNVWMGNLLLQGEGKCDLGSLRCASVAGVVLEGEEDPFYVGRFQMNLTLPSADDDELRQLEERRKKRLDSQPRPARFQLDAFAGQWKLLLAENTTVSLFRVEFDADGRFRSINSSSNSSENKRLAGSWGVFDYMARWDQGLPQGGPNIKQKVNYGFGIETPTLGTHVLLRAERKRCSGVPAILSQYFWFWGKPEVNSLEAELSAKLPAGCGYVDSVNGFWYNGATRGRFSLERVADV